MLLKSFLPSHIKFDKTMLADVHAALAYYFDHRADIDKDMADGQAFAESLRHATPSKLKHKLNAGKN